RGARGAGPPGPAADPPSCASCEREEELDADAAVLEGSRGQAGAGGAKRDERVREPDVQAGAALTGREVGDARPEQLRGRRAVGEALQRGDRGGRAPREARVRVRDVAELRQRARDAAQLRARVPQGLRLRGATDVVEPLRRLLCGAPQLAEDDDLLALDAGV